MTMIWIHALGPFLPLLAALALPLQQEPLTAQRLQRCDLTSHEPVPRKDPYFPDLWSYCRTRETLKIQNVSTIGKSDLFGMPERVIAGDSWSISLISRWKDGRVRCSLADVYTSTVRGPALALEESVPLGRGRYKITHNLPIPGKYSISITLDHADCHGGYHCPGTYQRPYFEQHQKTILVSAFPSVAPPATPGLAGMWLSRAFVEGMPDPDLQMQLRTSTLENDKFFWYSPSANVPLSIFNWTCVQRQWLFFLGDSLDRELFSSMVMSLKRSGYPVICSGGDKDVDLSLCRNGTRREKLVFRDSLGIPHYVDHWWCVAPTLTLLVSYKAMLSHEDVETLRPVQLMRQHHAEILLWIRNHAANATFGNITSHLLGRNATPTTILVNYGLHASAHLPYNDVSGTRTDVDYMTMVKTLLTRLQRNLPARLLWRDTAYTHFPVANMSPKMGCRSSQRVDITNVLANRVVNDLGIKILGMANLTRARRWAAPDNRHYGDTDVNHAACMLLLDLLC